MQSLVHYSVPFLVSCPYFLFLSHFSFPDFPQTLSNTPLAEYVVGQGFFLPCIPFANAAVQFVLTANVAYSCVNLTWTID